MILWQLTMPIKKRIEGGLARVVVVVVVVVGIVRIMRCDVVGGLSERAR